MRGEKVFIEMSVVADSEFAGSGSVLCTAVPACNILFPD